MNNEDITAGLIVGHWRVLDLPYYDHKKTIRVKCVSRCGVVSPVGIYDLRSGRPFTCEACRAGCAAPPQARVRDPGSWDHIMAVELLNPETLKQDNLRNGEWPAAQAMIEVESNERERAREMAKAGNLAALLKALELMG